MKNLNLILDQFRHIDDGLRIVTVQCFMTIAFNEKTGAYPLTVSDLVNKLHITMASASRHVMLLSETRRQGDKGLGLITITRNPEEGKGNQKLLTLTTKGKKLYDNVHQLLE